MLLICPNCDARYVLPSHALGDDGREVRCAKCKHSWYQEADDFILQDRQETSAPVRKPDEHSEETYAESGDYAFAEPEEYKQAEGETEAHHDDSDKGDSIPESVKPDHEAHLPAFAENVLRPKASLQAKLTGYAAAATIFAVFILSAMAFKGLIVSAWPPSAAIFELAGIEVTLEGEQLVMESLNAKIQQDGQGRLALSLQGRVINLTNEIQPVPQLLASLRSTNGETGDSWQIETPLKQLEPGESFTFTSEYPAVPRGVGSVNLTFLPSVKL